MKIIDGGVLAAKGFKAAGIAAGIKDNGNKDMALLFADKPAATAIMTLPTWFRQRQFNGIRQ